MVTSSPAPISPGLRLSPALVAAASGLVAAALAALSVVALYERAGAPARGPSAVAVAVLDAPLTAIEAEPPPISPAPPAPRPRPPIVRRAAAPALPAARGTPSPAARLPADPTPPVYSPPPAKEPEFATPPPRRRVMLVASQPSGG